MSIFFITGTSGAGKTTLTEQLQAKLSQGTFAVHDFDECGVPEHADAIWRQATTDYWISIAQENVKQGKSTIICGVCVPTEVLKNRPLDMTVNFGFIKLADDEIVRRLQLRGWNEQLITDNINWAHYLETEVRKQPHHIIVESTLNSTADKVADQFIDWILSTN